MDQIQKNLPPRPEAANLGNTSDDLDSNDLAQQKLEARLRLLAMPPEEAQRIVEQTLYPQLWECCINDNQWEESLPTHYGEIDT